MAVFPKMQLTSRGIALLTKAQSGIPIKYTKAKMGSGIINSPISILNDLVHTEIEMSVSGEKVSDKSYKIGCCFDNKLISTGFEWREIGIFAEDPQDGEILYSYANAGDAGDYIPPASDKRIEKFLYTYISISNAENIVVETQASEMFLTIKEFNYFKLEIADTFAPKVHTHTELATNERLSTELLKKADKSTTYTKTETDLTRTYTLTHSKSGAVHTFTELPTTNGIYQCQFVAVADYAEGETFADGYTAKPNGEETKLPGKAFISGDIVSVTVDVGGKKLGFKLGGGGGYGTLSPQIRSFTSKAGNHQITLNWANPSDSNFAGLYLVRKQGSMPTKLSDGTKIDVGKATSYTDKEPLNGKLYYYRAFTYNAKKQVQTELTGAVVNATPKVGIPIKSLPVGTLVVDPNTKYYNQPIVWKIADQNHWEKDSGYPVNATTLISDKILTCKCFDAKEPNNSNDDRRRYGNNYYYDSNLRQWLNSGSPAGQWYTPRHSQDASPTKERTLNNAYDMQAGFLNDFSSDFRNILLQTLLRTVKNTITDGGGSESFYNEIITASCTEVGSANENGIAEGAKLDLFNSDFSRKAVYTEVSSSKDAHGTSLWWLRTPHSEYVDYARNVDGEGKIDYSTAYTGVGGVRPLCNLPNNTYVNSVPNSDGSYNIVF